MGPGSSPAALTILQQTLKSLIDIELYERLNLDSMPRMRVRRDMILQTCQIVEIKALYRTPPKRWLPYDMDHTSPS